ncbi:hypothetical protein DMENIID0001_041860 [Sergentomyia squamirostris]
MSLINTSLVISSSHWKGKISNVNPRVIGSYSVDENQYVNSLKNMKYLRLPEPGSELDLNVGFETYQIPKKSGKKIDHILKFITSNPEIVKLPTNHPDKGKRAILPDVVCQRGLLSTVMMTPFHNYRTSDLYDGWTILAMKFRGTLYFWWDDTWKTHEDQDVQKTMYYGQKFRHLITTENPNESKDITSPVTKDDFFVTLTCNMGNQNVLYSGEILGVESNTTVDVDADITKSSLKLIEMHIKRSGINEAGLKRNKYLAWWCKTFLMKIETIYVGKRTAEGILQDIEPLAVKDIPEMTKQFWTDGGCLKFCEAFLDTVKDLMKDVDDPNTIYEFSYYPKNSNCIQYKVHSERSQYSFLPEWYIDFIDQL